MINFDYTLRDSVYRYAIKKAAQTCNAIPGVKLALSGGAIIQLAMRDHPEVYRPTSDVDLVPNRALKRREREGWIKTLEDALKQDGFKYKSEDDDYFPVKVHIEGLSSELYISLTKTYKEFHSQYQKRMEGEFDRLQVSELERDSIPHQSIADIIVGKVVRFWDYQKSGMFIDPSTSVFFSILEKDSSKIRTSRFMPDLEKLAILRNRSLENLGRMEPEQTFALVYGYKLVKDIYDICCVFDNTQENGGFNLDDFKEAVVVAKREFGQ